MDADLTVVTAEPNQLAPWPGLATSTQETDLPLPAPEVNAASLADIAQRDLHASLQLLAERMQYITGASAASIALRHGTEFLYSATAGPAEAELGAPLRADPSLVNQSILNEQIICCNNTRNAIQRDGTSYRDVGIKAIMIMTLVRESHVAGILELVADRTDAFDDRDGEVLEHLSEMVFTALEHADAAKRATIEIVAAQEIEIPHEVLPPATDNSPGAVASTSTPKIPSVHFCDACGFPVSGGRKLCLDCEEAQTQQEGNTLAPGFLSQLAREESQGWLETHFYTIGIVLMILLTVVVLMLKLR